MIYFLQVFELHFNSMRLSLGVGPFWWSMGYCAYKSIISFHLWCMHQKVTKHGRCCMHNSQLQTKSHVELEDNSIVFLSYFDLFLWLHRYGWPWGLEAYRGSIERHKPHCVLWRVPDIYAWGYQVWCRHYFQFQKSMTAVSEQWKS